MGTPPSQQAPIADGITFAILNAEPCVVVPSKRATTRWAITAGALGFAGIVNNVGGYNNFDMAIKFDLHNDAGEDRTIPTEHRQRLPPSI